MDQNNRVIRAEPALNPCNLVYNNSLYAHDSLTRLMIEHHPLLALTCNGCKFDTNIRHWTRTFQFKVLDHFVVIIIRNIKDRNLVLTQLKNLLYLDVYE